MDWHGVFPAITTPFTKYDLAVDERALARHVGWMVQSGVRAIVPLGSLGEGNTLSFEEKLRVIDICRDAAGVLPIVPGIAALSTAEAIALVRAAGTRGCSGAMVLPPYVYRGDARETLAHFDAVLDATPLPCMLYNNPIAYGTDVRPEQIAQLAQRHRNLVAVKESSADVRRITALRTLLGDRLALFVGVDDLIIEGCDAGAVGWIAGLVNAFPRETVDLFERYLSGERETARTIYDWFLPLLRMDTVPKFVQLIKLAQAEVDHGSETVRPPRLPLEGDERAAALATIREAIATRPGANAKTGSARRG
jgi:4-hydroxy-tetrahydrodipicolinate synthase